MAELVFAAGSSHSPLLASPPEDYAKHAEIDRSGRPLLDGMGRQVTYGELLAAADPAIGDEVRLDVLAEKHARCNAAIARLSEDLATARLDALIVVGDDQKEQYHDDNMPSVLIYWGESIVNRELDLPADAPAFWRKARSQFHEAEAAREYPVASALGLHLIEQLVAGEFDISHGKSLPKARGEGHAFGFVHRRLMGDNVVPIVPVALNTYFPPNQPRPRRCFRLGAAIREAVAGWDTGKRVGILASGGLTHFAVDAAFDRRFLAACQAGDGEYLGGLSVERLQSGSSEMRNWIVMAGAAQGLPMKWVEYVPCYRSPAGTGCGMGFAVWS